MKDQARVLGIDDAPFLFSDEHVPIIGALLRPPSYLEAVMRSEVDVDGSNSTESIVGMVKRSRYLDQVKLILLDGIALGGFNLVDIDRLSDELGVPVATVTRDRPDLEALHSALEKHFVDWKERWEILTRHPVQRFETGHNPIFVSYVGIEAEELMVLLRSTTVQGAVPEPLRVAHLIATAFARGESYGRA